MKDKSAPKKKLATAREVHKAIFSPPPNTTGYQAAPGAESSLTHQIGMNVIQDAGQVAELRKKFQEIKDSSGKSMWEVYEDWLDANRVT